MKKIVVAFIVLGIGVWWWRSSLPVQKNADGQQQVVIIESGMSLSDIARILHERAIIRSPLAFQLRAWFAGSADRLQAGAYELTPSLPLTEVIDALRLGRVQEVRVTIPEGLTLWQIDALMASKGFGNAGDLLDCARRCDFSSFDFLPAGAATDDPAIGSRLEGYLFPETYSVPVVEYHPKFFLERMLGEFRRRIVTPHAAEVARSGRSLADLVIMASLVEEESRHDEERAIIAGILWKRLDNKVVLGVDATTRYESKKQTEPLTKRELEELTPYNTRRRQGLPPTPIANASASSFLAALRPAPSRFWYYLHDTKGQIHYAETDADHVENKRKFL